MYSFLMLKGTNLFEWKFNISSIKSDICSKISTQFLMFIFISSFSSLSRVKFKLICPWQSVEETKFPVQLKILY